MIIPACGWACKNCKGPFGFPIGPNSPHDLQDGARKCSVCFQSGYKSALDQNSAGLDLRKLVVNLHRRYNSTQQVTQHTLGVTFVELSYAIKMRSKSQKSNRFQAYSKLFPHVCIRDHEDHLCIFTHGKYPINRQFIASGTEFLASRTSRCTYFDSPAHG